MSKIAVWGVAVRDHLVRFFSVFSYSRRAVALVWQTSVPLTLFMVLLTLIAGLLPAAMAYTGKLIVDATVAAMALYQQGQLQLQPVLNYVVLEAIFVLLLAAAQRGLSVSQSLLRVQLAQQVNMLILAKAQTLSLSQFEDSDYYDKLNRAKNEASSRPISLVVRTFGLMQNAIILLSLGTLLAQFSPLILLLLVLGAIPGFIAEAKFSGDAFRLSRWHSPESRMQIYLETILTREDCVKEVKLFQLAPSLLQRYSDIFSKHYKADRALTLRRDLWGFLLGVIGTCALYLAYGWIVLSTITAKLSLGQMTMYLMMFRQGQGAVTASLSAISGMYEDNLYLSTLYEFLNQPAEEKDGIYSAGPMPGDGIRFEQVSFTYPGATKPSLSDINLHIKPGCSLAIVGENGAGKSTLIKLLARLYRPQQGQILLDGLPLQHWQQQVLHQRIGIIFQDFLRFQFEVGENIGTGDVRYFHDELRWQLAAERGMAASFIQNLSSAYHTQLGRWFQNGQELSGGQWQKIALARAFMRQDADILVLDEPTAAMDAQAEAQIFEQFRQHCQNKMAVLISHRFSTVRMADQILVIEQGRVIEAGDHRSLVQKKGRYAELFELQAQGYA